MDTSSFIKITRVLGALRQKAADALFHLARGDADAARVIGDYARADVEELSRLWKLSTGGRLPSSLARHVGFWQDSDHYDILRIDIRDIERELDREYAAPEPDLTPTELVALMHPLVTRHGLPHLQTGHLREAVLNSFTAVFDRIRERTGMQQDGDALVTRVFSVQSPRLILSELETESGRNDQVGFMSIFQGAYKGVRNPKAHSLHHDLTPLAAAQYLILASLLLRRVDAAKLVPEMSESGERPVEARGSQ